jgi:NAD(P)-dependent dehydrogenase (short-subunit alcohol dehydrogenase family)
MIRIAVIDGQGGGIGALIVKRLREEFGENIEIIALGTNSTATTQMLKAKANKGATGENAIVYNSKRVDMIVGTLSIIAGNGMLGELTPAMANAIANAGCPKILLPLNQEQIHIVGVQKEPLPHLVEKLIEMVKERIADVQNKLR